MGNISKLLNVPVNTLNWMDRKYFMQKRPVTETYGPTLNAKATEGTRVTLKNLTPEEFAFITSQENQRRWAVTPICLRCVYFHR